MNAPRDALLGLVYDMPFDQYLAIDAVSASTLRAFARSPWHYRNRVEPAPTRQMLRGTLAHCALLEPAALHQRYTVVPADAPKRPTKAQLAAKRPSDESRAAMEWWQAFAEQNAGREIVSADDLDITRQQLAAIAREPDLAAGFAAGRGEVSVFWIDEETGLYCKARPDWVGAIADGACDLLDLKSTADESPSGFGRSAARMKYHLQAAHYVDGFQRASGLKVGRFIFAAVTSAPPVLAVPYVLTDEIAQQADDERRELMERLAWCKREDQWPAYGQGVQLLDFPAYAKRSNEVEIGYAD